jgi:peptidoglycan/xylan/chitin deacetylase (PgdA/CDA1 family)
MRHSGAFIAGRQMTRAGLMIVGWHGVSMGDEHVRFPSLFISPESFRRRLDFLRRTYRVIPLDEAVRQLRNGRLESRQVVLTFDDGFHNFYSVAAPILREYGMPATVYAITSELASDGPNTTLLVRDLVLRTRAESIEWSMNGSPAGRVALKSGRNRDQFTGQILALLKNRDYGERLDLARKLAAALGVDIDAIIASRTWHHLSAFEMRELSQQGFSIQLHTHHHLNVVDHADVLDEELRLNRQSIVDVTGSSPVHFCYPSGCWSRETWPALERAGIASATTTKQGPNLRQTPAYALRRVLNGEDRSQLEFEFELSNLRWLAWAAMHPRNWRTPTPHTTFKQNRVNF